MAKAEKCKTKWCRNQKAPNRNICHKCKSRKAVAKYPEKYAFYKLRHNAKRRGVPFELTMDEFIDFCRETGYMEKPGRGREALTVDRIDNRVGYKRDNIRAISNSENASKGAKDIPF